MLPSQCLLDGKLDGGSQLEFSVQAPLVKLSTGILKMMDEKTLVVTLAHELAHYFRGHSAMLSEFKPYFFELTPENELRKPTPSDRYPQLSKALLDLTDTIAQPTMKGARYNPRLAPIMFKSLDAVMRGACRAPAPCAAPFAALSKMMGTEQFELEVKSKIGGPVLSPTGRDLYLKFEKQFLEVGKKLGKVNPAPLKSEIDDEGLGALFDFSQTSVDLISWLDAAHKKTEATLAKGRTLYEEAARKNLGYYSMEEEADEIAAEITARVGLSENDVTEAWVSMFKFVGEDPWGNSNESCRALQKNGWKVPQGSGVLLGQLADEHHSACYRAYNTHREWQAHQLDRLAPAKPLINLDAKRWKALQDGLKDSKDAEG